MCESDLAVFVHDTNHKSGELKLGYEQAKDRGWLVFRYDIWEQRVGRLTIIFNPKRRAR